MERRGDGVPIIKTKTLELTGSSPRYEIVDESNLVLTIPAATLELNPADTTVTVYSEGKTLSGVDVLAIFPNKTAVRATTDKAGKAVFDLYRTNQPLTIYIAAQGYSAGIKREWMPKEEGLAIAIKNISDGGAIIFHQQTGHLPGLQGSLNPIRDEADRTYLYADNITIEGGRPQPVHFRLGNPLRLTDACGFELSVTIIDIIGGSALVEYRTHTEKDLH